MIPLVAVDSETRIWLRASSRPNHQVRKLASSVLSLSDARVVTLGKLYNANVAVGEVLWAA